MTEVIAYVDADGIAGIAVSATKPLPVVMTGAQAAPSTPVTGISSEVEPSAVTVTVSTSVTRPSDTNAYAANDAIANSTSAPTVGGFTLTSAARVSGGAGEIVDALITSSADPATTLAGEVWIYDQAGTATNDNAAFAPAVGDRLNLVCVIPFVLNSCAGGSGAIGSAAHVVGINALFTAVGSANLRFFLKAKNVYTPISGEVFQVRLKIRQLN